MKKTILVCNKELGTRAMLDLILRDKYRVFLVNNRTECLKYLQKDSKVDLAFIGVEDSMLLRKIKDRARVVILSGYKSANKALEMVKEGASDFIVEPFSTKDILETVERALK